MMGRNILPSVLMKMILSMLRLFANGKNTKTEYFPNWKDISVMMPEHVKFGEIRDILYQLGFEEKHVEGSHIRFRNPYADAVIVLSDRKIITFHHFRMIEKVLEEKGIISREEFERIFFNNTRKDLKIKCLPYVEANREDRFSPESFRKSPTAT